MISQRFFLINKSGIKLECQIDRNQTKTKQSIVFIAGGFGSDSIRGNMQIPWFEWFHRMGFATFRINFRGIGESGGELAFATTTAGLEDMHPALDYIRKSDWADLDNFGLMGHSYGGGLLFHEIAAHPEHKYKFLILLSPRVDTQHRYESDPTIDLADWKKKEFIIFNGDKGPERRHYSLYSDSLNFQPWGIADKIKVPTLIIHGDKDDTVPYEQSVRLHKLIKSSDLITLHGCKHQYHKCGYNDQLHEATMDEAK